MSGDEKITFIHRINKGFGWGCNWKNDGKLYEIYLKSLSSEKHKMYIVQIIESFLSI